MKSLLVLSFILVSCASALPPKKVRTLSFVEKTGVSKDKAFSRALSYIGTHFADSSSVVKVKDKEAGLLVLKGNTKCNIFRQTGDINDYMIKFNLTINIKIKKVRMLFEDLYIAHNTGKPVNWEYLQLTNKEKVQRSSVCLDSLRTGLIAKISNKDDW